MNIKLKKGAIPCHKGCSENWTTCTIQSWGPRWPLWLWKSQDMKYNTIKDKHGCKNYLATCLAMPVTSTQTVWSIVLLISIL